jgi:sec-independent protein translocase protein TatA
MNSLFAFFGSLGTPEIIVLLLLGVILFGRKLPDVGRYLGKSIVEFKKGVRGLEDDLDTGNASREQPVAQEQVRPPQRVAATAPKFEDVPAPPNA